MWATSRRETERNRRGRLGRGVEATEGEDDSVGGERGEGRWQLRGDEPVGLLMEPCESMRDERMSERR